MAQGKDAVDYVSHQPLLLGQIYGFGFLNAKAIQKLNPNKLKPLQNFYQNVVFLMSGGFDVDQVK